MESEHLAGASVVVMRGDEVLLRKSYGFAELSHQLPASSETTYRVLGPALGIAVMQQVERGKLSLDADVTSLLPEFPWQQRRVTLRQLLDATSGLPDLHYLGDAHLAQRAVAKARDEVSALFAGRPFTHEPGERLQWTISGFHLAGVLLERVTGRSFGAYLQNEVIGRAGLTRSYHCDDRSVVPGLARPYEWVDDSFRNHPLESASLYPFITTLCASASDTAELMRAIRHGRVVSEESYRVMRTPVGAAAASERRSAIGMRQYREGDHIGYGTSGSLMGYSSGAIDFPEEDLTVVVLSNTLSQAAGRIARALAREVFGLSPLPPPTVSSQPPATAAAQLSADARAKYVGTYRLRWTGSPGPMSNWCRTYRVFESSDALMMQALGEEPERLTSESPDVFRHPLFSSGRVTFTLDTAGVRAMKVSGPTYSLEGKRIGDERLFLETSCDGQAD